MKVSIANEVTQNGKNLRPGDIIDIEDEGFAKDLITGGYANEVDSKKHVTAKSE